MSVYLLNIALIFIWAFFLLKYKPSKNKKKAFCAIACVQWVILSGLRGMTVGADTIGYRRSFYRIGLTSWHKIFANVSAYIGGAEIKDPGYALFVKITAAFLILGKTLYEPFAEFVGYDVEEEYLLDTYSYTLVICLLTVSAFVLYRFIKKNTDEEKFKALYNAALFTTAFTLLTLRNQSFMRVQQWQPVIYAAGVGFLILKLILNHPYYAFFWQ